MIQHSSGGKAINAAPFNSLACPLDGKALSRHGTTWRCASEHSFDIARQGYIHLLPVQKNVQPTPAIAK